MKSSKREIKKNAALRKNVPAHPRRWLWAAGAALAALAVFWAYTPALHGPFLFDDTALRPSLRGFEDPLAEWLKGLRPVLMFSYWLNAQISGEDTYSYHVFNLLIHCFATGLLFFIVRRLLEWARLERRNLLAGFAALVFLLHPVQTEAVAYLSGRSESLSVMLVFTAFAVFLYRKRPEASWVVAAATLLLFGVALLAKEQTVVLPALLLLTDYWWNPGFSFKGVRGNWRLYAPAMLGAAGAAALFLPRIVNSLSAGFSLKDLTWYQYFFTQCRALFVYPAILLAPVKLTVDWDFPISKTVLDRGAIIGLLALLALAAAAWHYRRRFPLATYGFFVYLLLMAPTSSVLPIRDPVAERRLYFSMIGLLLIAVDLLARLKVGRRTLAAGCLAVVLLAAVVTRARAQVWGDPILFWTDAVAKSPHKARPQFQLAFAYFDQGRYDQAIREFERTVTLQPPTYGLLVDWGLAYDAVGQSEPALEKFRQAAVLDPTAHVYTQIAMVYAKRERWSEALDALATADKLDSNFAATYLYRGKVYFRTGRFAEAAAQYQRALEIEPKLDEARRDLQLLKNGGH